VCLPLNPYTGTAYFLSVWLILSLDAHCVHDYSKARGICIRFG